MASLAKYIFNQYLDTAGAVLNAGTITAYATGTTNLKDIYTTSTGDVAAANPYTLGTDGSANFYLDGSYDLLLKNSAGDTLKTINVVSSEDGAAQAVVNTLAALRALASGAYTVVDMLGSASAGDGAEGMYWWDSTSTTADDGVYFVQPSSSPATGRWVRMSGDLRVYGATPSIFMQDTDGGDIWEVKNTGGNFTAINNTDDEAIIRAVASTKIVTFGYESGTTILTSGSGVTIAQSASEPVGFFGTTPAVQQAGIANADGQLADITTKFNTLLSELSAYGLLAAE